MFLATAFAFAMSFSGVAHADLAYYLPFSSGGNASLSNLGTIGGNGTTTTVATLTPTASTDVPLVIGDSHSYNFPANAESSPRGGVVVLPGGNSTFRMNTTGDQMTISTWINWNGSANGTATSYIVSNMNASQNQGWAFGINSSGRLRIQNSVGTVTTAANATVLTTGSWNHVALRYTAGPGGVDPNFFINGEQVSRGTSGFFGLLGTASTQTTRLSTIDGQYLALNGKLDDFAMWDNTLSQAKARALYTTPTALYNSESINGYNAGVMNSLFTAYDALGSQTVGGLTWLYTTFDGTGYSLGDTYSVGDNNYIYLGGNGTSASGLIAGPNTGNATVTLGNGTFIVTNRAELGTGTLQLSGVNLQASANMTGSNALTNPTWQLAANSQISGNNSIQLGTHIGTNSDFSLTNTLAAGRELVLGAIGLSSNASTGVTMTLNSTNSITTINGVISNNGTGGSDSQASGLTITGSGGNTTLSGTAANTYSGNTTMISGTLRLDKTSGIVAVGGDLLLSGSSKLLYGTNKNEQIANTSSVTINGTQSVFNGSTWNDLTGAVTVTETIANLTVLDGQFNTGITSNWTITGAGSFDGSTGDSRFAASSGSNTSFNSLSLKAMTGLFFYSSADSFFINGNSGTLSTLSVGSGGLLLDGSTLVINMGQNSGNAGSRLILDGNITTTGSTSSSITSTAGFTHGTGDISLSSVAGNYTRTITTASGANLTIALPITNGNATAAGILKDGAGTLFLTGNNTYTGATTISAGTLNISSTGLLGGGNYDKEIINNGVLLYSSSSNQTLAGPISGTGSLTKNGSSTLTLTGANTFSGVTLVNSGTLVISHALALQNSIIDAVFPASFALNGVTAPTFGGLQGSRDLVNTLGGAAGPYANVTGITLNPQTGVSTTYSGIIANGAAGMTLTKTGDGTQILAGANTYTGATTISAGTLQIGNGSTTGSISASSAISNNGTLVINRSDAITLSNTISGTGNLTKLGSNTLTLGGASANTFNGTTSVSAGSLTLDKTSGIVAVGGNLILNGSSKLLYGASKNDQFADTTSVTINGSQSVFNGSTWSQITGAATVTETIANLTLRNGQFNTGVTGNWTVTGAGLFDGTSGDSRFVGFSGSRTSFNSLSLIGMNGTTLLTTPDSFAINGNAATLSTLLVGSGGLFLDGSNLVINRGLNFGNVGSRLILEGDITTTGTSSSQILSLDGNNFGTSDISLSSVAGNFTRTITTGNGANLTIALPITNGNATAAGILKNGAGTLILSGTNTYTGATTISAGTLSIASVNNLSSTSGISIGDTGVLAYTGAAATLNRTISVTSGNGTVRNTGSGLLTLSGTLTKNGTTLRLAGGSGGIAVSGAIVGSNANSDLLIDGGSVTLASANSYNGPTAIINGATLTASVVNALPTANGRSAISIDATGTGGSALALAASQSIASLSGAASSNVTLGSNTLTVGTTSGSTTFAGRISGTGGLIKDGASTLVLTGSNTYTGNTTVAGGTLQAASAGALANSSVVNVSSGSLLVTAGNSVNNNAAINLGGGTLALSGTFNETVGILTLSANSVINLDGFTGTLRFDGVGDWAPTANLAIWNWNGINQYGTPVGNGANNRHVVFTNNSGLSNYLDRISFYSDSGSSFAGNSFEVGFAGGGTEIIAVPEPETYLTIIFMLSVLGIYKLRSLKRKPASAG